MKKIVSLSISLMLSGLVAAAINPLAYVEFDHEVDLENMPAEVRSFLDSYAAVESGDASFVNFAGDIIDSVGPLLGGIEYDQGTPYNDLCPIINGNRAITGCVATATAQIMRYWKYPQVGKGTATYTGSGGATTYVFADHPFDWNNMLESYTYSKSGFPNYNANQASAVATLMLACGASVNMNYAADASGSYIYNSYIALREHFDYTENMKYFEADAPNWEDWTENLKAQFDMGLPVLYAGTSTSGGHAFVLDGYKTEDLGGGETKTKFHVNWGWSGEFNGWFLLFKLQPNGDNYSNTNQCVVLNIYPKNYQAIDGIEAEQSGKAVKELRNGQVVIIRNNRVYSIQGQRIE